MDQKIYIFKWVPLLVRAKEKTKYVTKPQKPKTVNYKNILCSIKKKMYVYFVEIIPFTFTFMSTSQQRAYTKIHLMSTLGFFLH